MLFPPLCEAFSCDTTDSTRSCGNTLQDSLVNESYDSLMLSMQRTLSTRVGFSCVYLSHPHFNCVGQVLRVSICYPGQQAYRMKTNMVMVKLCPIHLTPKSILAIPPPNLTCISSEIYVSVLPQIVTLSFQTQELPHC